MKGWKICKESEGERIWGGIEHEILNAAASTDGLANGSSLKRPAAPTTCTVLVFVNFSPILQQVKFGQYLAKK